MSGIVAIDRPHRSKEVSKALARLSHRGTSHPVALELHAATLGMARLPVECAQSEPSVHHNVVFDGAIHNWRELFPAATSPSAALESLFARSGPGFLKDTDGPFALIIATEKGVYAARDPLGIAPLYEGMCGKARCYASEAKALIGWATHIREFPPGYYREPNGKLTEYQRIKSREPLALSSDDLAVRLRRCLSRSVEKQLSLGGKVGAWLSGGLDSSAMVALAREGVSGVKTFAAGLIGAPDLEYARRAAAALGVEHHELTLEMRDIIAALPDLIYHLESFDAQLVRSSAVNFLVGKLASDHVDSVFSGEGGDELFAGYEYPRGAESGSLMNELGRLASGLHSTALQRADRCSAAHGLIARLGFLDREVVELAIRIPAEYKLRRGHSVTEKWILRQALQGILPDEVLTRTKTRFAEGAGVGSLLAEYAESMIPDAELAKRCRLPDGSQVCSKEELLYYRIFEERFGKLDDLSFVNRSPAAPTASAAKPGKTPIPGHHTSPATSPGR